MGVPPTRNPIGAAMRRRPPIAGTPNPTVSPHPPTAHPDVIGQGRRRRRLDVRRRRRLGRVIGIVICGRLGWGGVGRGRGVIPRRRSVVAGRRPVRSGRSGFEPQTERPGFVNDKTGPYGETQHDHDASHTTSAGLKDWFTRRLHTLYAVSRKSPDPRGCVGGAAMSPIGAEVVLLEEGVKMRP